MKLVPLDKNESYWLLDDALIAQAHTAEREALATYPSYGELRAGIAAYAGVTPDMVFATPGSDAAIEHLARRYAGGGKRAVLPVPTFYGYEAILDRAGAQIHPVPYDWDHDEFVFPLGKTVEALAGASAVFLCQPNNPLGCPIPESAIEAIATAVRNTDTVLVSDEAYFEFSGRTMLPLLGEMPNLIILRTFSKGFGIPGARVGYAIAASERIRALESQLLMSPIAHASARAALALLARADDVRARRELVIAERERFREMLSGLPSVIVYPSETNFILMRVPDAQKVRDVLLAEGVQVALGEPMSRYSEAKRLLAETVRIAVPSPTDHQKVKNILTRLLHE